MHRIIHIKFLFVGYTVCSHSWFFSSGELSWDKIDENENVLVVPSWNICMKVLMERLSMWLLEAWSHITRCWINSLATPFVPRQVTLTISQACPKCVSSYRMAPNGRKFSVWLHLGRNNCFLCITKEGLSLCSIYLCYGLWGDTTPHSHRQG